MRDPAPIPTPAGARPKPVFAILASIAGTLCVVALGTVAIGLWSDGRAVRRDLPAGASAFARTSCAMASSTDTADAARRREHCELAAAVQQLLVGAGAYAANVTVTDAPEATFGGPAARRVVLVQLIADDRLRRRSAELAGLIGVVTGADTRDVVIVDDRLVELHGPRTSPRSPRGRVMPLDPPPPRR